MKALMVAVASLLFSTAALEERGQGNNKKTNLTDSFADTIKSVFEDRGSLIVNFQRQNSSYRLGLEHPQYADIKAMLEKAQKVDQKLKVIAIIPSMTIQKIEGIKG